MCAAPPPRIHGPLLCVRSGLRLSKLAVFQPGVTFDSVGAGVKAQREPRTPLCRSTSVTSVQAEKLKGFFCERGKRRIKDSCEVILNLRRSADAAQAHIY